MRLIRCDVHPDREAVATFKIREMPIVGFRPILLFPGVEADTRMTDLCAECAEPIRRLLPPTASAVRRRAIAGFAALNSRVTTTEGTE